VSMTTTTATRLLDRSADNFDDRVDRAQVLSQIARMTLLSISGGRVAGIDGGIKLPVSNGYTVEVLLAWNDTYTVRRVLKRGAKEWVKGERTGVYAEDVSEAAYFASCFRSHDDAEWTVAR
jgi:hypothetical protein